MAVQVVGQAVAWSAIRVEPAVVLEALRRDWAQHLVVDLAMVWVAVRALGLAVALALDLGVDRAAASVVVLVVEEVLELDLS